MRKDRIICKKKDCETRTCSRHYYHLPKWYYLPIDWRDLHEECEMYRSKNSWRDDINFDDFDIEEDEDDTV